MTRVQFEELLPHEYVEARTNKPVAYLPVGTLEWHGEHDCLGLDAVKAHALAVHFAKQGGGLAFPAQFWGDNREYIMESRGDPEGKIAARFGLPRNRPLRQVTWIKRVPSKSCSTSSSCSI